MSRTNQIRQHKAPKDENTMERFEAKKRRMAKKKKNRNAIKGKNGSK